MAVGGAGGCGTGDAATGAERHGTRHPDHDRPAHDSSVCTGRWFIAACEKAVLRDRAIVVALSPTRSARGRATSHGNYPERDRGRVDHAAPLYRDDMKAR